MSEADDPKRDEGAVSEPASPDVPAKVPSTSADDAPPPDSAPSRDESPSDPSFTDEKDPDGLDEVDLREMMRQALERPPQGEPPDLLRGVQRRIRTRSRGKFYGDGWSTTRAPRSTYLMTSILMLVLIAFVFLVLIPWGGGALQLP